MIKEKIKKHFNAGLLHIFGSSMINKIIGFISSFMLVRILTKIEYGTYTYALNIYSLVLLLSGMGMESAVFQLTCEHSDDEKFGRNVSAYGIKLGLCVNVFLGLVLLFIGLFVGLKIENARKLLIMLCALPLLQLTFNMSSINLRWRRKNKEYSRLMMINSFFMFVCTVSGSLLLREEGMVLGQYIAFTISILLSFFCFRSVWFRQNSPLPKDIKTPLIRIALISMINNGLSHLIMLLDVFVLGLVDPQETILAGYKVATVIPTALLFIPQSLVIYIYPYFAEHKDDKKWCMSHFKKLTLIFGAFNLFVSAFLFLFAPFIIRIVFGEQYLDCVTVFRLLSLNYFISATFRTVPGNLLVTQRKLKFNLVTDVFTSICNVIFDYFFIKQWGMTGAAIATIGVIFISAVFSTVYLIYTFRKGISAKQRQEN